MTRISKIVSVTNTAGNKMFRPSRHDSGQKK